MSHVPTEHQSACQVHVQEVQCGDPTCAPIDTVVMIMFDSGGRGQFGMPMESREVTAEVLEQFVPPENVLRMWFEGSKVEWSPFEEEEEGSMGGEGGEGEGPLRFGLGTMVQCRTGSDPVTGWSSGSIIQLWYREEGWPPGQLAPYKIQLDDGRNIFAPADQPEIIRAQE